MNQESRFVRSSLILGILVVLALVVGSSASWAADKKVVLMWTGKAGMAKRVASGFLFTMQKLAPNVEVIQHRELADMGTAEQIFKESENSSNGIVFLRSNGAQFLGQLASPPKVPCFVGGCNNPLELGAVKNLDSPEGMITGVTYFIPYEKRFEVIRTLFPNVKSVGLLLQKGHPATPIDQAGTKAQCVRHGMTYHEVIASDVKELTEGTRNLVPKVDLFIISSTGLVMDSLFSILAITNVAKKPIFSYASDRAEKGATAELAANDSKLGSMLAESVMAVVVKGMSISKVPVKMDPEPETIVNGPMLTALNLSIPDAVLKKAKVLK